MTHHAGEARPDHRHPSPDRHRIGEATGLAAAVITCSDSKAAGAAQDVSGPVAADLLRALGHRVSDDVIAVPDDVDQIAAAVLDAIDSGARIVVTTGGTGPGPRDITPEALRHLGVRELPGLGEAMRAAARQRVPATDLSRALGGVLGDVVVLALPGSPGGVRDGLTAVGGLLAHAADMAAGGGHGAPSRHVAPAEHIGPAHDVPALPQRAPREELIREAPVTESEVADAVRRPDAGAVVTFAGRVRDHDSGRAVTALHYEAHPDAARVMEAVLAEARTRPGVLAAAAVHRVGDLAIGDLAFVAAVSAAHRSEAFATCAWLVDEVKARLPVWKRQHFADGSHEWVSCA